MRVLFSVIPERGHINPYIGPAQALAARGHEVAFYAPADISSQLSRAGLAALPAPGAAPAPPDRSRGRAFAEQARDAAWLRCWIERLLVEQAPEGIAPLQAAVEAFAPDVLVTDPMVYPAAVVARAAGIPWAAVSNSLNPVLPEGLDSALLRTVAALAPARERFFAAHGLALAFRGCDMLSPHLTVAFTTAALVGAPPAGVALVGPSRPRQARGDEVDAPPLADDDDPRPLILMSLGSQIYHQPRMFQAAMAAVAGRPVRLLISAAELHDDPLLTERQPDNVTLVRGVSQLEVLERARVMISHGGANSFMEATAAGVPLLLSPICNDQFHQAWFLEQRAMGIVLDLETAAPEAIWRALAALLAEDSPWRANTRRVAADYAAHDGAEACAALIEALA